MIFTTQSGHHRGFGNPICCFVPWAQLPIFYRIFVPSQAVFRGLEAVLQYVNGFFLVRIIPI
jgi:hypothetical protein